MEKVGKRPDSITAYYCNILGMSIIMHGQGDQFCKTGLAECRKNERKKDRDQRHAGLFGCLEFLARHEVLTT